MESSSSTVRRRAWSTRQWPTLEELERPLCSLPSASIADDDVFSDGCFTGKIENWLLSCGPDARSEKSGQLSFESVRQATNFTDDLSLGADASGLNGGEITPEAGRTHHQGLCLPSLNLGHSMASSCFSSSTWRSASSVAEVLQLCSEDAEETLFELGFGYEESQVTVRIPPRFFTFPSQAQGINFRLFLDSQLRRIREEDPSLSLASRFRQVQVLTAMANAFYSLYSHVSRTPLQKLATPEFTFSSSPVERFGRLRSSARSEPRSPVERLKDTVNKMCLYTGSPRGSDSTSPQSSPRKRSSLPEVVDTVLKDNSCLNKKLDLEEPNWNNSVGDVMLITDDDRSCYSGKEKKTQQTTDDTDIFKHRNKVMQEKKQTDIVNPGGVKQTDTITQSVRTSLASTLSGETVIETEWPFLSGQPELNSCLTVCDTRTAELMPVAKVTYDLICPQIIESVHQAPFCSQNTHSFSLISSEAESKDIPCSASHEPLIHTIISEHDEDSYAVASSGEATQMDASRSPSVREPNDSYIHCCITVTGCERDDVSSCSLNTADSSHASSAASHQKCEESSHDGEKQYLNPLIHQGPGHFSNTLKQVNSFELEEVHSAGEEECGNSESTTAKSLLSMKCQYKGEVVRGDSMQSDSSGYADEEVSPSSDRHSR